jgi:hypothetical protein
MLSDFPLVGYIKVVIAGIHAVEGGAAIASVGATAEVFSGAVVDVIFEASAAPIARVAGSEVGGFPVVAVVKLGDRSQPINRTIINRTVNFVFIF